MSADKINHKQFAHLYLLRPTLFQYMCAHVYKNIQIVNEQVKTEPGVTCLAGWFPINFPSKRADLSTAHK